MAIAGQSPAMMTRREVAARLGVSVRWLEENAMAGPSYYRLNATTIRYDRVDVESWLRQRKVN